MSRVRVICLGNAHASDDGAALQLAGALAGCEVRCAGRPGAGLLDLLEGGAPVVLVDATQSGAPPGTIHTLELAALEWWVPPEFIDGEGEDLSDHKPVAVRLAYTPQ